MIPIDFSEVIAEFGLSAKETASLIEYSMQELAGKFYETWRNTAAQGLRSTREEYVNSLEIGGSGNVSWVKLNGDLPNMLESGAQGWDMKPYYESNAVHTASGGWYATIPFRHATSQAIGENSVFSNVMPLAVEKKVKEVNVLKAGDIPKPYDDKKTRPQVVTKSKVFEAYVHKSSIYEGLQRAKETYSSATQSQYVTFRRVSNNSDADAWIHKGFDAKNFADKALDNFDIGLEIDAATDTFLSQL